MKPIKLCRILLCCLSVFVSASVHSRMQPSIDDLYAKAISTLKNLESNDSSGAERLFEAILEQDPKHPRALWQLTFRRYGLFDDGATLSRQAARLAAAGPGLQTIVDNARHRGDQAFAHYVLGRYAGLYKTFDQALLELDKALAAEPKSIRYRVIKGLILIDKGEWEKDDTPILQGMELIEQARQMAETTPSRFYSSADYYFKLAYANAKLDSEDPQKTIEYYLSFLQSAVNQGDVAFAWNNLSIAYRQAGDCDKALDAAEHALTLSDFGAARSHRQYAQFCLEMRTMGLSVPVAGQRETE